jgi:hypothetical protein
MRAGLCPRQQMQPAEPSRSPRRVISMFLPIVVALILLPALAFASPPDPSWIAGIYDGADGDDIVNLVYDTAAAHAAERALIAPLPCLVESSFEKVARGIRGGRFTRGPRAPPVRYSAMVAHVFTSLPNCTSPASGTEAPVARASIITSCLSRWDELHFLHWESRPRTGYPALRFPSRYTLRHPRTQESSL